MVTLSCSLTASNQAIPPGKSGYTSVVRSGKSGYNDVKSSPSRPLEKVVTPDFLGGTACPAGIVCSGPQNPSQHFDPEKMVTSFNFWLHPAIFGYTPAWKKWLPTRKKWLQSLISGYISPIKPQIAIKDIPFTIGLYQATPTSPPIRNRRILQKYIKYG